MKNSASCHNNLALSCTNFKAYLNVISVMIIRDVHSVPVIIILNVEQTQATVTVLMVKLDYLMVP